MDAPPTPPPMMTTRARAGSSRGLRARDPTSGLPSCAGPAPPSRAGAGKPLLELRPRDCGTQTLEVRLRILLEVEVELRDLGLHDPPRRLPRIRENAHQLQRGATPRRRSLPVVADQKALVVGVA